MTTPPTGRAGEAEIFESLRGLCASPGYIHVLAYLSLRDNFLGYRREGMRPDDLSHVLSPERLNRPELLLLQGLLLRSDRSQELPGPAEFDERIARTDGLLREFHDALNAAFVESLDMSRRGDPTYDPFNVGRVMREPIFYAGESAYLFQYREMAIARYRADNPWLLAHHGFTIDEAAKVLGSLASVQERKIVERIGEFATHDKAQSFSVLSGFCFEVSEVAAECDIAQGTVTKVLDSFAAGPDERNEHFTAPFNTNLASYKPLIRDTDGSYFGFLHYALGESLYVSPTYWMRGDLPYSGVASKNRGDFAESFVYERLAKVFGPDVVFANVEIVRKKGEASGEIDVLVIFGDRVLVVQTKSKQLVQESRAGDDEKLRADFAAAVSSAYDQGYSCACEILDGRTLVTRDGETVAVPSQIKEIFILCVGAEHYPGLSFQARTFLKPHEHAIIQPPFVLDVFTLDVLTEFLESPLYFLSYVQRRVSYNDKVLASHELTVLAYHLKRNLWMPERTDLLLLDDSDTAEMDIALYARRDGVAGATTPPGILTHLKGTITGNLLRSVEQTRNPDTLDFGFLLLKLSAEGHAEIASKLQIILARAARDGECHDATVAFDNGVVGVTFHATSAPRAQAEHRLVLHCRSRKYIQKSSEWYGVCLAPGTGELRFGINFKEPWKFDADLERQTEGMVPDKSMKPVLAARAKRIKVGRNDPCPCGSGKKFKKCCEVL